MGFTSPKPTERSVSNGCADGKNSQRKVPNYSFYQENLDFNYTWKIHCESCSPNTSQPKEHRTHRKLRKGKMTRVENSPTEYFCASTPYFRGVFHHFSTKPFTNLQHQPHSRQVMEDSLLLMLVKQRIKYRIQRAPISGCLPHYWPRPEQPFYSRTPTNCDKIEHKIFHKGELRQYGLSTLCCPCCYQVSFP